MFERLPAILFCLAVAVGEQSSQDVLRLECESNLRNIAGAIREYVAEKGGLPGSISELSELGMLDAADLFCPAPQEHCDEAAIGAVEAREHFPGTRYSYEFSLRPLRAPHELETQRSYKKAQQEVLRQHGIVEDLVPIVRCHCHGKHQHLNMPLNGTLYVSDLLWERVVAQGVEGLTIADLLHDGVFAASESNRTKVGYAGSSTGVSDLNQGSDASIAGEDPASSRHIILDASRRHVSGIPIKARAQRLVFATACPVAATGSAGILASFRIVRENQENDEAQLFGDTPSIDPSPYRSELEIGHWAKGEWLLQLTSWINPEPDVHIEACDIWLRADDMKLRLLGVRVENPPVPPTWVPIHRTD